MIDEKRFRAIKGRVPVFVKEGLIKFDKSNKNFMDFYITDGELSLVTAELLFRISNNSDAKKFLKIPEEFDSYLWVINTAYYSMFYFVGALLAKNGIKVDTNFSVHSVTFDAFVYYFFEKLERHFFEEFEKAQLETQNLLGEEKTVKEKAAELIEKYDFEKNKRSTFTYEMGNIAKENKAETSLKRAKEFIEHIKAML